MLKNKIYLYKHLSSKNATHYLECSHCCNGKNQPPKYYNMRCIILRPISQTRLKILVFGERNWKNKEHIKKIRYVDSSRVIKI
jgi:hypothetical protein